MLDARCGYVIVLYGEGSPSCERALINEDKLKRRFLLLVGFLQEIES